MDSLHHSQLPLNLPLIARAASLVRIVLLQKKEIVQIVSGPGAGPLVFSPPAPGEPLRPRRRITAREQRAVPGDARPCDTVPAGGPPLFRCAVG